MNYGFTRENPFALMVDSHHGRFCWQVFAEIASREMFDGITAEQWAILEAGPDHEHHCEVAWECEQAEHSSGVALHQDEDIWAYCPDYVGNMDDVEEYEVEAGNRIANDSELCRDIASLSTYANLMDGPQFGQWSQDLLDSVRDRVEAHCDAVNDAAPLFWHGYFGIEERRLDTMARAIVESPSIAAISRYW